MDVVLGIPNQIDPCPAGTYIPFSDVHQPGTAVQALPIGHGNATPVLYHVGYFAPDNSWWIQYDKAWIGRDPRHPLDFDLRQGQLRQWFGEKRSPPATPHPDGDDIYGTLPGSASVTGMFYEQVVGGQSKLYPASAHLSTVSDFRYWWSDKAGKKTFNSFHYGGPIFGPNGC